ncbi:MAG: helix-turn-helix domain-containing protein, partial [Streptococcaceae bacterium]|nr:helix-turn-helix domain-containing protein [Streptococcaceae bacterium]
MNPRYGKIFQKIRLQRNFTLDDFKALGISKASLSKFENNHNTISVERVNSALQEMNITLKEYEYFLNDFSHEFHEEVFQLIEESQYKGNFETLQLIEKDCLEQEQYLLSLAAKSSYGFLTFDEQEEIVDYLESLEKWSFFDISLLTFTVKNFRD